MNRSGHESGWASANCPACGRTFRVKGQGYVQCTCGEVFRLIASRRVV